MVMGQCIEIPIIQTCRFISVLWIEDGQIDKTSAYEACFKSSDMGVIMLAVSVTF